MEDIMRRNTNRGAFAALALAGGLWAWRNRDKIQGWLSSQREQLAGGQSFTGQTRRIGESNLPDYDASAPSRGIYDKPNI
jgi:hypothetical protein